ncbi:MAG: hypothetical protein PVJ49_08345 [Acidobacteriota bacterium]|jgi:hypothetical protein
MSPDPSSNYLRPAVAVALLLTITATLWAPAPARAQTPSPPTPADGTIIVYFLDHQFLPEDEIEILQREISAIFADADLAVEWVPGDSPRRVLETNELRLIVLASDGTKWFHGPSNVIGIAPHDDTGIGRNCWVFYRQAIWFRQQAVFRCREAIQARTEAQVRGVEIDPFIDSLAPAECGDFLPSLTAMIVARAAAHEMVHILLNKLDHSSDGLMRDSFDIGDWFIANTAHFRLEPSEIDQLRGLLGAAQLPER